MSSQRIMHNQANLEGKIINGLRVDSMVSRNPLRWLTTCQKCGSQANKPHHTLQSGVARCQASGCGRPVAETAADFRRNERDRESRIVASRDKAKREKDDAAAASLAQAERDLNETHRKLAATLAKRLQSIPDSELHLAPEDIGISCGSAEMRARNQREMSAYMDQDPIYYNSTANHRNLGGYFELNGVKLASHRTIAAAVARLREAGLIENAPAPVAPVAPVAPEPEPDAQLAEMNERDKVYETAPQEYEGYDLTSGRPRRYSEQELAYLSADQYRRAFKIPTAPIQRLAW